jgi:hypothetical protein
MKELPDLSKYVVVAAAVLYVCGFLCVTGYLARFGIITFDIVNARFIIAGIHVALPLAIAFYIGWHLHTLVLAKEFPAKMSARLELYGKALLLPLGAGAVLSSVYRVAAYVPPAGISEIEFSPWAMGFGPIDYAVTNWSAFGNAEADYIVKYTVYITFHLGMLVTFFALLAYAFDPILQKLGKTLKTWVELRQSRKAASAAATTNDGAVVAAVQSAATTKSVVLWVARRWVDIFAIALILVLVYYSGTKLRTELFDAASFTDTKGNTSLAPVVWMYGTTWAFCLFLWVFGIRPDQPVLDSFKHMLEPLMFTEFAQRSLIPLLGAMFVFGATVFPRIPFAIGGGEPRAVTIRFADAGDRDADGKYFLLGESAQYVFVVKVEGTRARAFQLSKGKVAWIQTRDDKPVLLPRPKPSE